MKKEKKGVSKKIVFLSIVIFLLVIGIIAGVFIIESRKPAEVYQKTAAGGIVSLTYSDDENLFVIENALPTSDSVGVAYDSAELFYDFTVNVVLEEANEIEYEIILVKDEFLSTALNNDVIVYLEQEKEGKYVKVAGPIEFTSNVDDKEIGNAAMSLFKGKRDNDGNDNYRLRMWISDKAVMRVTTPQTYGVKVTLKGNAK